MNPKVVRRTNKLIGDPERVIAQLHLPGGSGRIRKVIQRIVALPDPTAETLLVQVMQDFARRHRALDLIFRRHLEAVAEYLPSDMELSEVKRSLVG